MKCLAFLICTLLATQAFSEVKELSCQIAFGEHTVKVASDKNVKKGNNYSLEEHSISHAGYTCQCQWTETNFGEPYLTTILTLPSGASIKSNSGSKGYQYVTETQAQVACRSAVYTDY